MQLPGDALVLQRRLEARQVAAGARPHEGVHAGGGEALELPELREDVGARRDEHAGHLLGNDGCRAALVLGIEVREEEADGDRLDARRAQFARSPAHALLVERHQHLAGGRNDALAHHHPVAALHEGLGLPRNVLHHRVVLRALVAADMHDVAEAFRRDHPGHRATMLQHRVGGDGGAVIDGVDLGRRHAVGATDLTDTADQRDARIEACGRPPHLKRCRRA